MATESKPKASPQGNLELVAEMAGHPVSVMTVAADRYGVAGVLLHADAWGIRLQVGTATHPTFIPWVAVIQMDVG